MSERSEKINQYWHQSPYPWLLAAGVGCIAFAAGWFIPHPTPPPSVPLRLSGYQFVSPLLACGLSGQNPKVVPQSQKIDSAIQAVIDRHEQNGDISKASAFFIDYSGNYAIAVNGDKKYYPSSIGKIPIMMAYFAIAEHSSRGILDKEITYPVGSPDLNTTQDIKPLQAIIPGRTYSVNDLISYMIKYSDNNAAELLFKDVDQATLNDIYLNLGIPIDYNLSIADLDFITPAQVSMLFRILYNATYLSTEDSEMALKLLSQSSFTQGLAAGVPNSTVVAHKLGLVGIVSGGITTEHELHDCGIIYAPNRPYLLCVMTRGASPLPNMENTIADISRTAYQAVTSAQ
jgi:beta-lactamase class A